MLAFNGGVREGEVVGKLWAILGHGPLMYLEPNEEHSKGEKMDRGTKNFQIYVLSFDTKAAETRRTECEGH